MDEEVKLVFVFSGTSEKYKEDMKRLTKFAEEEIGLDLEERHCVGKNTIISWFDPEAVQKFQQGQAAKARTFPVA